MISFRESGWNEVAELLTINDQLRRSAMIHHFMRKPFCMCVFLPFFILFFVLVILGDIYRQLGRPKA